VATVKGKATASDWSIFWRDFGEGNQRPDRCHVPGDGRQAIDGHLSAFAVGMPPGARVIDLGCGAGYLGKLLLTNRPNLQIIGVDFAEVPRPVAPGLTILPWVDMASLPFENCQFDAAVSLFGCEYSAIDQTALELARVLKPGSPFCLVVHHRESAIAREGFARVSGIRGVLSGKVKSAYLAGDQGRFEQLRISLLDQHHGEPTVKLMTDYLARTAGQSRAQRLANWDKLVTDVAAEVALTSQMVRCAKTPEQLGTWLAPFLTAMAQVKAAVLLKASGEPIAWSVSGTR
jgi:ubiquinone/menaquinone biosynthesis C-methylase UbiE